MTSLSLPSTLLCPAQYFRGNCSQLAIRQWCWVQPRWTKVDKENEEEPKNYFWRRRDQRTLGCDVAAPALTWEGLFINQTAQPELHNTLPSLECQHKLEEKHLSCNYGGWWLVEMWTLFLFDRPFANHHQGSGRLITFNQPTNIQNCFLCDCHIFFCANIFLITDSVCFPCVWIA